MVHAPTSQAETPLRQPPQDALTLRIIGGRRDGQSVRLTAHKCTIGSDRNCTLRIRAYGVRPVHCLIVRGPQAMVIRRWSGDTLLNNHTFSDAPLMPGDCISVGPIHLEVVASEADAPCRVANGSSDKADPSKTAVFGDPQAASQPAPPADWQERLLVIRRRGHARARRLVSQLRQTREHTAKAAQLAEDQEALAQLTREAAADVERRQRSMRRQEEQWEATHRQAEAHLTRRLGEVQAQVEAFERDQAEWQQACERFESERLTWEAQRDQAADTMRQREEQLEQREQQLESERNNLPTQSDGREEMAGQLESTTKLCELEELHELLQHQLEQAQADAAAARDEAEQLRRDHQLHQSQSQADRQKLLEREQSLARLDEELQATRDTLVELQQTTSGPMAEPSQEAADPWAERDEALRQREQAVQSRQEALAEERQQFERFCQERQTALNARQADVERQLTQQLEMLRADRANFERQREELIESSQNLDAQRRQWRARIEKTEMELTRRQRELDHLSSTLELERGELHEWQHELDRRRRPDAPQEVVLADAVDAGDSDLRETLPAGAMAPDPSARKSIASQPTASADDVFARLRELATTHEPPPTATASKDGPSSPAQEVLATSLTPKSPAESLVERSPQGEASESEIPEEASMEGYMSKLMHHGSSRRETLDPTSQELRLVEPSTSATPTQSPSQEAPAVATGPMPMRPRHVAPEMSSNIAAMRELANFHARSAIERHHSRRRWTLAATGKLIVAAFAAMVGTIALLWPDRPHDTWYYAGAISALMVAMFWGLQCALLARSIYRLKQSWLPRSEAITPEVNENAPEDGRLPNVLK